MKRFHANDIMQGEDLSSRFLFMSPIQLSKLESDFLPSHHDYQASNPAWRANLKLFRNCVASSFQGEYPGRMTEIPKGSLLSITRMFQKSGINKILFVNLQRSPKIESHQLILTDLPSNKVLAQFEIQSNRVNELEVNISETHFDSLLCLSSKTITGVPIYVSHSKDLMQLSLEHSHPPIECFVFGDRVTEARKMKHWWFDYLSQGGASVDTRN